MLTIILQGGNAENPKAQDHFTNARRLFKKAVQQGRSEVHDAKNNERHICGRARVGEPRCLKGEA